MTIQDKNKAAYLYNVAQVLMEHRHFDDARARYMEVIDQYPDRNEAAYSATAIIDFRLQEHRIDRFLESSVV